jgi:DNA-binding CsgD family transcriptional regulator
MDLAPLVRAVEVLMSPLEWGGRDVWLDESRRRVRAMPGFSDVPAPGTALDDLDALLRLPGEEPGWLTAALESTEAASPCGALPPLAAVPEQLLPIVSLRCALAAGLATLHRDREGLALPTTQELRISFGLRGREPQVALLAAEGLSNVDIARRLRLSAHTVRHYLERVLDRLGLHSRKAMALRLTRFPRSAHHRAVPRTSPDHPGRSPAPHLTTSGGPPHIPPPPAEGPKNSTPSA